MNTINDLEKLGYRFRLDIDYTGPRTSPANADALLSKLASHKPEALLYLAGRGLHPSRTLTSEQYRSAINKGVLAGDNPYKLLLQAVKCISGMTGDKLFYTQNLENIKAIYGAGLLEPALLQIELAEVQARLKMLTRPELESEPSDSMARIKQAVKSHKEREAQILKALEEAV